MTIHKLKGLKFPVLFCIGFVDGVRHACGDIEEERRIAFMGIVRAMKLLFLSHAPTRMIWQESRIMQVRLTFQNCISTRLSTLDSEES